MEEVGRQQRSEVSLGQESVQDNEGSREGVGEREQEMGDIACNNVENIVDKMGGGSKERDTDGLTAEKSYKLKSQKLSEKKECKKKIKEKYEKAANDYKSGKFKNLKQAAAAYDFNYSSFYYSCIEKGGEFQGSGCYTKKLTHQEEMRIF